MASTYVNDLRLNEMATGDQSGSWGTVTNTNLELIGDAFGYGTEVITTNANDHETLIANGAVDAGRSMFLKYTGALDSPCTITISAGTSSTDFTINKLWFIENATTGSQNIIITSGSGANVTIPAGHTKCIYTDGAGSGGAVVDGFAALSVVDLLVDDALTVSGGALLNGATPTLTIGDAGAEDAKIVFDGNAADYHVGLDDSEDALQIGLGSALGTTPRITIRAAEVVVNDLGIDLDFRVESNLGTNAFFVDGAQGGAVGIGVTPEAWNTAMDFVQVGTAASFWGSTNTSVSSMNANSFYNAAGNYIYINANYASQYLQVDGKHIFYTAPSGSADATISFSEALTIDASGNLIIANTGGTLYTTTAGISNFRAGKNAGNSIVSGSYYNVLVGDEAGTAITGGDYNTAVGYEALMTEDADGLNTAIGARALKLLNAGADGYNTAVGYVAGQNLTLGIHNTLIGAQAGDALTDADYNVAVGMNALTADTLGSRSVAIGRNTLTTQNFTTATDSYNTSVGFAAGNKVTTGIQNTLIGGLAGDALTGNGFSGSTRTAGADYNTAVGMLALSSDTKGNQSTAIGYGALVTQNFTTATDTANTAVGYNAGTLVNTGYSLTFVGANAGASHLTGAQCTFIGSESGNFATTSDNSTFVGHEAGRGITGTKLTGNSNTAVGAFSGANLQGTAADNTLLGKSAGDNITTGDSNIIIGSGIDAASATADNQLNIGGWITGVAGAINIGGPLIVDPNTAGKDTFSFSSAAANDARLQMKADTTVAVDIQANGVSYFNGGNVVVGGTTTVGYKLHVYGDSAFDRPGSVAAQTMVVFRNGNANIGSITTEGSSTAFNTSSDYRLKTDAQPMTGASARVQALNPVNFEWIVDGTRTDGFLAHEAQAVVPECVTGTKDAMRDEEYEVTAAIEATYDDDGNELTAAVEAVMGTRSVPDMQGIDQSKIVPLLTAALQEALTEITALKARVTALEGA